MLEAGLVHGFAFNACMDPRELYPVLLRYVRESPVCRVWASPEDVASS